MFDVVLCNPPYRVPSTHKLDRAVRTHEPAIALFVPGDDAMVHYREVLATVLRGGILRPSTGVLVRGLGLDLLTRFRLALDGPLLLSTCGILFIRTHRFQLHYADQSG